MNLLLNIIWFVFGGFIIFFGYLIGALILFITIIGIPFGVACLRLSVLALAPFGRDIVEGDHPPGLLAVILNVIWIILPGIELALIHLVLAALFAITIIGLPIAAQHLKMVRLALLPFGFRVRDGG